MIIETALLKPVRDAGLPRPRFRTYQTKAGKKRRTIHAPNGAMSAVHYGFSAYLLEVLPAALEKILGPQALEVSTAYWPGSSPARNAGTHTQNRFVFATDLVDAYGSVPGESLATILAQIDPDLCLRADELPNEDMRVGGIRKFLRAYCLTEKGGLRFGGPASPHLLNLYCGWGLDGALIQAMNDERLAITRFSDDIHFSSRSHLSPRQRHNLLEIIRSSGFAVNDRKTRYRDMAREAVTITGIRLQWRGENRPAKMSASPELVSNLESMLNLFLSGRAKDPQEVADTIGGLWGSTIGIGSCSGPRWNRIHSNYEEFRMKQPTRPTPEHTGPNPVAVTLWNGTQVAVDPRK